MAEEAALAVNGINNSEGLKHHGLKRLSTRISNGFIGSYKKSSHSVSAVVLAGEGQNMERDYDYSSCCFAEDLEDPSVVGKTAGERAVKKLNPKRPASADIPVIYSPRVSSSLMATSQRLNGNSIARGTSF